MLSDSWHLTTALLEVDLGVRQGQNYHGVDAEDIEGGHENVLGGALSSIDCDYPVAVRKQSSLCPWCSGSARKNSLDSLPR
jgi:hypothetical protein